LLERAAEATDTFLTKAILVKLRPTSWSALLNCLKVNIQWGYMRIQVNQVCNCM
jgi:hypothetical protein